MAFCLSPVTLLLALALWLGATALTLAVATMVVLRLPVTYFSEDDAAHAGVPGQGLLMVLIGLMLVDFPGRRRVEKALARRPGILATVNRLRARFSRPPLLPPSA